MPIYLLLAMQAAGMIVDYFGTKQQAAMNEQGAKLQQAGIEANIYQTRLETEDASLQAMQKLRQNMGTQIATMAARGTKAGAGSSLSLLEEGVGNFFSDERVRRLNQMGREGQLRAGKVMSMLQNQSENSKLWQGFAQRTINRFPTSAAGWSGGASAFSGSSASGSGSFGMTNIGS